MTAYICGGVRTPIGKYAGALSSIRPDDLLAQTIQALLLKAPILKEAEIDDVMIGCANQAGEDNRNVARMSVLLAGLSAQTPATTINRLCGSGMDAIAYAARSIKANEASFILAGGVESMSRAPFVMGKAHAAFSRQLEFFDTTMGWRFINPSLAAIYGTDSMPQTAENVARQFQISREDQDQFALWSQQKVAQAQAKNFFSREICSVSYEHKGEKILVHTDEHPRLTSLDKLANLKPILSKEGCVTAGNAAGINDGAAILTLANESAMTKYQLTPKAKVLATAVSGLEPSIMGIGPVEASRKVLKSLNLSLADMDVIEINEAFAAQCLAVIRKLGLADDDPRINPNGGAIALGHPLGMSGTRLVLTAMNQLEVTSGRYALCCMCIGVGQGIAMIIENCASTK